MANKPSEPPTVIPEHELEQKRLEYVEWKRSRSERFDIDDVDYETVEKFIESCSETMVPAIVSAAVKAAVRAGCFRNDLAAIRFVATAMEEERTLTTPPQEQSDGFQDAAKSPRNDKSH